MPIKRGTPTTMILMILLAPKIYSTYKNMNKKTIVTLIYSYLYLLHIIKTHFTIQKTKICWQ